MLSNCCRNKCLEFQLKSKNIPFGTTHDKGRSILYKSALKYQDEPENLLVDADDKEIDEAPAPSKNTVQSKNTKPSVEKRTVTRLHK